MNLMRLACFPQFAQLNMYVSNVCRGTLKEEAAV